MRGTPTLIALLTIACHGASIPAEDPRAARVAEMDSATARRICESPDSVIAGTRDCVLRDQSRRRDQVQGRERERPPTRAP